MVLLIEMDRSTPDAIVMIALIIGGVTMIALWAARGAVDDGED